MPRNFNVKLFSHVLSSHEIVNTRKAVRIKVVWVKMGLNWVIEFRQVILVDYFVEILEVNQVSEILFNKLGAKRFSQPFLDLNDGCLDSLNGILNRQLVLKSFWF